MKSALKCVRSYSKCLKMFPKQMLTIFYNGLRKEVSSRCSSGTARQTFFEQFRKLSPIKSQLDASMHKLANFFNYATKSLKTDEQVENICCGYTVGVNSLLNKIKSTIKSKKLTDYVKQRISNLFGESVDFMCSQYTSVSVCQSRYPQAVSAFEQSSDRFEGFGILKPLMKFAHNFAN